MSKAAERYLEHWSILCCHISSILDVPDAPDTPRISDITNDSMVLSWGKPFDGGSPITDYILEKKEPYSSKWTPVTKTRDLTYKVRVKGHFKGQI